ncbi:hypothetical protein BKA56DRAFT_338202 [Ilyonectria sp. MPI-CAGE-AT-0026]|nr:hypothetical protein BKA56DRAFT_338202 [Ilyonectria sp. MPI-CAGE-AT-0026]
MHGLYCTSYCSVHTLVTKLAKGNEGIHDNGGMNEMRACATCFSTCRSTSCRAPGQTCRVSESTKTGRIPLVHPSVSCRPVLAPYSIENHPHSLAWAHTLEARESKPLIRELPPLPTWRRLSAAVNMDEKTRAQHMASEAKRKKEPPPGASRSSGSRWSRAANSRSMGFLFAPSRSSNRSIDRKGHDARQPACGSPSPVSVLAWQTHLMFPAVSIPVPLTSHIHMSETQDSSLETRSP